MTCSNTTTAFVGETHACHQPLYHPGMHSCGCGRTWHRLNAMGLTADDEPVQRKTGKRLSPERLAEIRDQYLDYEVPASVMDVLRDYAAALGWVDDLLAHIDAVESDLASCRAGQPRHKDGQ